MGMNRLIEETGRSSQARLAPSWMRNEDPGRMTAAAASLHSVGIEILLESVQHLGPSGNCSPGGKQLGLKACN